jgi:outer membrane protein assembly factor BamE (lipoprotein component of BamABCDE complex)
MRIVIITLLLLASVLSLSSCLSRVENRGYSFDLVDYKVRDGLSSKDEITRNLGSPTLISYMNDEEFWIYFEEKISSLLFFKPTILNRTVSIMSFNESGVVKYYKNYSLKDRNKIKFVKKITATRGVKKGFFADIFGNIGQISPQ